MNIFTQHTQRQGVTYIEHWLFAMGIAVRLFQSVTAFSLHAIFPFIGIKKRLDLEATVKFLMERNAWIETMTCDKAERVNAPVPYATTRITNIRAVILPGSSPGSGTLIPLELVTVFEDTQVQPHLSMPDYVPGRFSIISLIEKRC
jgi:hypothetical protein